ncbi:hypothetical protein AB0333_04240 [Citricoccus sp. NPDC079358]|uniref:hypothetical protein n=1 Tax=Citricoccus sp. NPDC079358 TaxID=3154653 RepID=UPI003450C0BC
MWVKVRSFPVGGAAVLLAAGLALTGCGNEAGPAAPETSPSATIPSETTSATPESSRSSRTAAPVDSLDELFEAVAPVPVVGTGEWFVADITEAGEGGTGAPEHQAATKDLGRLATELSADFSEG